MTSRDIGRGQLPGLGRGELRQHVQLARTQATAGRDATGRHGGRDRTPVRRQADPALEPGAGPGPDQRPFEAEPAVPGECPEAAQEARPPVRAGQVADGSLAALELRQQVDVSRIDRASRSWIRPGRQLGDEFQSLQEPGREHRPEHECRRRKVVAGDPAGQRQRQLWQERTIGPHAVDDRLGRHAWELGGLRHDDPERLAPPELDEDGLADHEVGQLRRDEVGVRPVAAPARRVDRDLDRARRRADRRPDLVAEDQGERE